MGLWHRKRVEPEHIVLEHLPDDVARYLYRKAVNSDGARALLRKYGHKTPQEVSKKTSPAVLAQLDLAVEPCPHCGSANTRKTRASKHGKALWACTNPSCLSTFIPGTVSV